LNVHGFKDVRQTEIHTAEPLESEPSAFDVKIAVEKLKIYKLASIDQISVELIKAEGRTIRFEIFQLINSISNKEELFEQWKESTLHLFIRRGKNNVVIREASPFSAIYKIQPNTLLSDLTLHM
jgi:hypothetical protein